MVFGVPVTSETNIIGRMKTILRQNLTNNDFSDLVELKYNNVI